MGVLEEREEQLLGEVQSTSCGTTLLKSKQPKYHSHREKTKSLDLRWRRKVPPDGRQKLALLRLKDVFRYSDAEQF